MSKPKVGQILDKDTEYTRDAIHVPIMSVVVDEDLYPGNLVSVKDGIAYNAILTKNGCGIIDPFIKTVVEKGEKCYVWLRPESTMRLWHEWTHPLVDRKKL